MKHQTVRTGQATTLEALCPTPVMLNINKGSTRENPLHVTNVFYSVFLDSHPLWHKRFVRIYM